MKVECPHCGARGQMDESKIPPGVTSLKCPRCKESFPIPAINEVASQSAEEASPNIVQAVSPPLEPPGLPLLEEQPPVSSPLSSLPAQSPPHVATTASANCKVCAGQFSREEMVRFGTVWVCAACKPTYVKMLAQGSTLPGEMRYASFNIRFGAKFLDGLILAVVNFLFTFMLGLALPKASPQTAIAFSVITMILQFTVGAAYCGFFLSKYRATPGKMACGLVVVSPEGEQVSFGRGVGRYFAELLSSITLSIGYLMVLFDAEKRSLHDRICNTRVIYK